MMVKVCEYLQYADDFTHITKKERPTGKKINKYQRLCGTSSCSHHCPLKAEGRCSGVNLLENEFHWIFFKKAMKIIPSRNIQVSIVT